MNEWQIKYCTMVISRQRVNCRTGPMFYVCAYLGMFFARMGFNVEPLFVKDRPQVMSDASREIELVHILSKYGT